MLKLFKDQVDKLYYKGHLNDYKVVDFDTEEVTDVYSVLVVEDKKTGKFYRGRFFASQGEVEFEEVKPVATVVYEPA